MSAIARSSQPWAVCLLPASRTLEVLGVEVRAAHGRVADRVDEGEAAVAEERLERRELRVHAEVAVEG
jgi:hypothetical protein